MHTLNDLFSEVTPAHAISQAVGRRCSSVHALSPVAATVVVPALPAWLTDNVALAAPVSMSTARILDRRIDRKVG